MRQITPLDHLLNEAGQWLADLRPPESGTRPYPAQHLKADCQGGARKKESAALMRVNHAGEVAAQGLYLGQALAARDAATLEHMRAAGREEADHLLWCERRLDELDSRISWLTPLWGLGSLAIGLAAGLGGDQRSLGFVEETERQVAAHLESHLACLPEWDERSRAIVQQMRSDEDEHRRRASEAGATRVSASARFAMAAVARVMTRTAYWV